MILYYKQAYHQGKTELLSKSYGTFQTPFIDQTDIQLGSWRLAQFLTHVGLRPSLALLSLITVLQLDKATDILQYIPPKITKHFDVSHRITRSIMHFYIQPLELILSNLVDNLL